MKDLSASPLVRLLDRLGVKGELLELGRTRFDKVGPEYRILEFPGYRLVLAPPLAPCADMLLEVSCVTHYSP